MSIGRTAQMSDDLRETAPAAQARQFNAIDPPVTVGSKFGFTSWVIVAAFAAVVKTALAANTRENMIFIERP
jgi:hypothetical protein